MIELTINGLSLDIKCLTIASLEIKNREHAFKLKSYMLLIIHTGTSNETQISDTLKSSQNKVTFNVINFFHSMSFSFI